MQSNDGLATNNSDQIANANWVILKFGGSSVSAAGNWPTIATQVRACLADGRRPLVVLSALENVSNLLEAVAAAATLDERRRLLNSVVEQHYALAAQLNLDGTAVLAAQINELESIALQAGNLSAPSPHARAAIVAQGELLSTRLGVASLTNCDIDAGWVDARTLLRSRKLAERSALQNYLSAICDHDADASLAQSLGNSPAALVTQGFLASNEDGETVLLGREGSDTSAAYLASILSAERLEIWTDVPGMFSADPRQVSSARLLNELSYEEAQELASTGSKVLHPRSISPLKIQGIPLFIRCTAMPEIAGTRIGPSVDDNEPQVKGLSMRADVTLIAMQSAAMWHEVGFLADAFASFKRHGVSVDLISTSETNVTVTIDTAEDLSPNSVLEALVADLQTLCRVNVVRNCAVVTLVGQKIRTILPRLAPVLSAFEDEKIHLLSQAANDLNLSFVIDASQAQRLLTKLHSSIIRKEGGGKNFGPSWEQLNQGVAKVVAKDAWWQDRREQLLKITAHHPNAYVYDLQTVRESANGLLGLTSLDRVLYAMKANSNPSIIRELASLGVDFDCVSPGEVRELQRLIPKFDNDRILFTPNFAPKDEYVWAIENGLQLTLDNLYPLQHWPEIFLGQKLFIRVDPGRGRGHHEHVKTAGVQSKFGIPLFEIDELARLADEAGATIVGLHAHTGSGILDPDNWNSVAESLVDVAQRFPEVKYLDLGGGIGVPEKSGDEAFDLVSFDKLLTAFRARHPDYGLWVEPGRFLVAQAGVLISRVTQMKGKGDFRYVGIGTGMNSLIRPALYGAYHEIVNLSRIEDMATQMVTIVGPICETGDKLGSDRMFPETKEGDVVLIANAGAYGRVMASDYNMREIAAEIVI